MAREYHDLYARTSGGASLRPGARDALDALRAAGVGMSVLSSCEQSLLEAMLARHGIGAYFGLVRGQDNLYGGSKLDAGRRLVRALGAAAAHAVLVGDTTHDFDVAASLGCGCVLLTGGHQSRERLLRCDCPVMDDVGELLNPAGGSEPWAC